MRDDRGQMMLLTAFVLVIAFVALSGMVSRVTQLPEETRQLAERPVFREAEAVIAATAQVMQRIETDFPVTDPSHYAAYLVEVDEAMRHMVQLEGSRGLRLIVQPADCVAGTHTVDVMITLTSADTRFTATVSHQVGDGTVTC